ncbi:MAG TPA: hypothetical protein PKZ32_20180 [Candidatus Melainabacteria bacterium]|nr:hypothetical protein [Candidatus Melainabacteria bacterium]
MGDGSSFETSIAQLSKKIDEQARFTRSVVIICTLTILGVVFYTMTEMFSSMPANIVLHFMGNMEKIVYEWKAIETSISHRAKNPPPAPAPQTPPSSEKEKAK